MEVLKSKKVLFINTCDYNYRKLAAQREFLGIKCDQAANFLGVTTNTLSRWENGKNKMHINTFLKYCDFLKSDPLRYTSNSRGMETIVEYTNMISINDKINQLNAERNMNVDKYCKSYKIPSYIGETQ